eukprot:GEZU01024507.1.p1 GENE.GEZU01024507.1~~GEZU01024507.1.p1  ORF type:complete len:176 (-),score=19.21 GEZU01024507.1:140-589(-)
MTLHWEMPIQRLDYNPLLITCCEGLRETDHPYVVVARQAFKDLLETEYAQEKTIPLVPKLVLPLRLALQAPEPGVFDAALDAISQLSDCVGPALNEHLSVLLVLMNKKIFDKKYADKVLELLTKIETNSGPEVVKIIKAKVPTYTPLLQ